MKKRIFLVVVLIVLIAGGALAQTHWISADVSLGGGGVRYEYLLVPAFTLGGYFYFNYNPITEIQNLGFGAAMRLYPFSRRFFLELGLGFNQQSYESWQEFEESYTYYDYYGNPQTSYYSGERLEWTGVPGFALVPGFGWTLDIGRIGGFFLAPQVKFPITLGHEDALGWGFAGFIVSFGVGYAF